MCVCAQCLCLWGIVRFHKSLGDWQIILSLTNSPCYCHRHSLGGHGDGMETMPSWRGRAVVARSIDSPSTRLTLDTTLDPPHLNSEQHTSGNYKGTPSTGSGDCLPPAHTHTVSCTPLLMWVLRFATVIHRVTGHPGAGSRAVQWVACQWNLVGDSVSWDSEHIHSSFHGKVGVSHIVSQPVRRLHPKMGQQHTRPNYIRRIQVTQVRGFPRTASSRDRDSTTGSHETPTT